MRSIFLILVALLASPAFADTYTVAGTWTDGTPPSAQYVFRGHAECQVNGAGTIDLPGLSATHFSTSMTAAPGDTIRCRVQNINVVNPGAPLAGNWSAYQQALAPAAPTTPSDPTGFSMTVTRAGP